MTQVEELNDDILDGDSDAITGIHVHPEHPITPESFGRLFDVASGVNASLGLETRSGRERAISPPTEDGGPTISLEVIRDDARDIKVVYIFSRLGNLRVDVMARNDAGTVSDRYQIAANLSVVDNEKFGGEIYETESLAEGDIVLLAEELKERLDKGSFVKERLMNRS